MAFSETMEAHVAGVVRSIHQVQKLVVLGSKGKAGDDPSRATWATAAEAAPNKAVEPKRTEKEQGVLIAISCHT
jgi:hypothetical protein